MAERKLSQNQLADMAGVSGNTINSNVPDYAGILGVYIKKTDWSAGFI